MIEIVDLLDNAELARVLSIEEISVRAMCVANTKEKK